MQGRSIHSRLLFALLFALWVCGAHAQTLTLQVDDNFTGRTTPTSSNGANGTNVGSPSTTGSGAWIETAGGEFIVNTSNRLQGTGTTYLTNQLLRPTAENQTNALEVMDLYSGNSTNGPSATYPGIVLRFNATNTYYWFSVGGGGTTISKIVSGTRTDLATGSFSYSAVSGHALRLVAKAVGTSPTALAVSLYDMTSPGSGQPTDPTDTGLSGALTTITYSDSTSGLQTSGQYGLTCYAASGNTQYTRVRTYLYTVNNATGYTATPSTASGSTIPVGTPITVTLALTGGTILSSSLVVTPTLGGSMTGTLASGTLTVSGSTVTVPNGTTSGTFTFTPTNVVSAGTITFTHTGGGFSGGDPGNLSYTTVSPTLTITSPSLASDGVTLTFTVGGSPSLPLTPTSGLTGFTVGTTPPIIPYSTATYTNNPIVSSSVSGSTVTLVLTNPVPAGWWTVISVLLTSNLTDNAGATMAAATNASVNNISQIQLPLQAEREHTIPGVYIPFGALNQWRAIRGTANHQSVEVAIFGDSTTDTGSDGFSSWVKTIRTLSTQAGYADGGRGAFDNNDNTAVSGENLAGFSTRTGYAVTPTAYNLLGGFISATLNDSVTFQGYGNKFRLLFDEVTLNCANVTYQVDGGSVNTINPFALNPTMGQQGYTKDLGWGATSFELDGLSGSTISPVLHTIVVTNTSQSVFPAPPIYSVTASATNATYSNDVWYEVTANITGGETQVSPAVRYSNHAKAAVVLIQTLGTYYFTGSTQFNIYRSSSGALGTFYFVGSVTGGNGSSYTDANGTTTSQQPPTVVTAALGPTPSTSEIQAEFLYNTGIVYHKDAVAGSRYASYFDFWAGVLDDAVSQVYLGMVTGSGTGADYTQPSGSGIPNSQYRHVAIAFCALGINDKFGGSPSGPAFICRDAHKFIVMCKNAGITPVLIIPGWSRGFDGTTFQPWSAALRNVAVYDGVCYADFNTALDNAGFALGVTGNPHLNQAGNDVEGAFLWTNILNTRPILARRNVGTRAH